MRALLAMLLLLSHVAWAGSPAIDRKVEGKMLEVKRSMASTLQISGGFTQEKSLPFLKDPIVSTGFFHFSKPGSLVWEYVSPAPSGLKIENGKASLWTGPPEARLPQPEAMARPAKLMAGQVMLWMNFDPKEILAVYEVSIAADSPLTFRVVPRKEGLRRFLKAITVVLEDDLRTVRSVVLSEEEGETILTFQDTRFNQEPPPETRP